MLSSRTARTRRWARLCVPLIAATGLLVLPGSPALAAVDDTSGEIHLQGSGLCVDLPYGNTANGTQLQIHDCTGSTDQKFTVKADGTIQIYGKCLDVKNSGTVAGTVVQLYTCNATSAQQWQTVATPGSPAQVRYRNPNSSLFLSLDGGAGDGVKLVLGSGAYWRPPATWKWPLSGASTSPPCANGVTYPGEYVRNGGGTVADFNGTSQYCAAPGSAGPVLDAARSFSVAAWVKLKPFAGLGNLTAVSQDSSRASSFFLGYDAASGKWAFRLPSTDADNPAAWTVVVPTVGAATESWTHLIGSYDAGTHKASLYVNGLLAGAVTVTNPVFTSSTDGLVIGRGQWQGGGADYWLGRISNVRTWTYALSGSEANQVYFDGASNPTCATNHCYALVHANDAAMDAVSADLSITCLSHDSPGFTTNEMWLTTQAQPDGGWVEIGQIYGVAAGSSRGDLRWFWGDYRGSAAGGFYQHVISSGETGVARHVSVYSQGGGNYNLYLAGNSVGSSTGNGLPGGRSDYGSESWLQKPYITSYIAGWNYRKNGTWVTPPLNITAETPPYHPWLGSDGKFNIVSNVGCTGAPATLSASASTTSPPSAAATPVDANGALATALAFGALNADRHPARADLVHTRRQKAMRTLTGAAVNTDPEVYVIRLHGRFVGLSVPVPQGHATPVGNTLTVTVDAATGDITDWSLGDQKDLATLGSVTARTL